MEQLLKKEINIIYLVSLLRLKKIRFRDPMTNMLIDEFFLYDTETKIVYVLLNGDVDSGITPYYVLDENGKPEIAIYGENYNG